MGKSWYWVIGIALLVVMFLAVNTSTAISNKIMHDRHEDLNISNHIMPIIVNDVEAGKITYEEGVFLLDELEEIINKANEDVIRASKYHFRYLLSGREDKLAFVNTPRVENAKSNLESARREILIIVTPEDDLNKK